MAVTREAYAGIDIGTQGARVLIADVDGAVLGTGRAPLHSMRADERHEQAAADWWAAVCRAAREATADLPLVDLRAIAVCGTSGTIVPVDVDGHPRGPALMYDDGRAVREAAVLNELGAEHWRRFGYARMQPAWALPRLLWLRRHTEWAPETRVLHQTDFVNRRLVGAEVPTDVSTALKTGCDVAGERWPHELLAEVGIDEHVLPELVRPGRPLGTIGAEAARESGFPAGVPVLAGMTDSCAAQLASGAVDRGSWNSVLGTTLALKGVTPEPLADPDGVVYSHRSPGGDWLPGGASGSGTGAVAALLGPVDHDELTAALADRAPTDLLVYPLATERGERFPFVAPTARRFVCGEPTDRADLYAGLLLGVALVERLCFDYLDLLGADCSGPVHLTGSAAGNRWLGQLRADVLQRRTVVPAITEPAFGMAVLGAGHDHGIATAARRMVRLADTYEPSEPSEPLRQAHRRLVAALEARGWLPAATADHARERLAR